MSRPLLRSLVVVVALAGAAGAHDRLRDPTTLLPLAWPQPGAVGVVISATGSDDLLPAEHFTGIRNAIATWNSAAPGALRLVEDASPASQARTDYRSYELHQVLFDEEDESGYFPPGSGIVAITPVTFALGGSILDADVILNGGEYRFTSRGEAGAMDVQNIVSHELGHMLGLDHTGLGGATLYPFVVPGQRLQRSLSADDVRGALELGGALGGATIRGRVLRSLDATTVSGAQVSVLDEAGRSVAAGLCAADGSFRIEGLPVGAYRVSINPLRGVVGPENLGAPQPVHTDFQTVTLPTVALAADATVDVGEAFVPPQTFLHLGERAETLPLRAIPGQTTGPFGLSGRLLAAGTTFEASDPDVRVLVLETTGLSVTFRLATAAGAAPGHCDLVASRFDGSQDRIPAAIEITAPDPLVSSVQPPQGDRAGGTLVTVGGSGFRPGSTVVVGGRSYRDGADCTVLDDSTIELATVPSVTGLYDLTVIDATGVEGRRGDAFRFTVDPVVDSVFPRAGSSLGGTVLTLKGRDFEPDVEVALDGVVQPVTVVNSGTLRITTTGGAPGTGRPLSVRNPGVVPVVLGFDVVAAVDPRIASLLPDSGRPGTLVHVQGSGFTPDAVVVFGADPETGLGGVPAAAVAYLSPTELEVGVPGGIAGPVAVLVMDSTTSMAAVLDQAFTIKRVPSRSGGGSCRTVMVPEPPDARIVLGGAGWFLLLLLFALQRRTTSSAGS